MPTDKTITNRRQVLLGLAAASTAAATATNASAAENPVLVKLGEELPTIEAEYVAALKEGQRSYAAAMANWPLAPQEILCHHGDLERDIAGAAIRRDYPCEKKGVMCVVGLDNRIQSVKRSITAITRTKAKRGLAFHQNELAELEAVLPLAKGYWAKVEGIKATSDYQTFNDLKHEAMERLREHVTAIMAEEEKTMLGVVIKAQALQAWSKVERAFRVLNAWGARWSDQMATAIIRQAGVSA